MLAALALAGSGRADGQTITWEGDAIPTPGDGFLWTNALNWSGGSLPAPTADLAFGTGTIGTILLNGNQTANSLKFTESFTLGAYGTNQVLTNTSGNIVVSQGDFVTMNASYGGTNGINLSGGGSLFLNHPLPTFAGNIFVDGPSTSLVYRGEGVYPQYNGIGSSQEFGRTDQLTLGYTTVARTITLTNGGEYKILATGNNPEGGTKNVTIGTGGGAYNVAAGYQLMSLDDVGQLANAAGNTLTKRGAGRLSITGTMADNNTLAGDVVVDGGMLDFSRLQGGVTTANTRFAGITGASQTTPATNKLTINNGGVLMLNNGTAGNLDVASVIANNGAILGVNGADHGFGMLNQGATAGTGSTLTINGTVNFLARDLFGPQTQRAPRINSDLTGSGTIQVLPSTQAGSSSRLVIQRSTAASTFDGVFKLTENASLEANPRANATADTGKVLAGGDIEFAGWGGTLDVRDSTATTSVFDYTANEITISTNQVGAVNSIALGRATTAAGSGHLMNFGTLTMGSHRLAIVQGVGGNNNYQTGFADTANIRGNAVIEMRADSSPLVFSNAVAISEDAAGRSLTLIKTGIGNTAARDVISGGAISISNLEIAGGTLQLRGAKGAITTGAGGAAPTITINGGGSASNYGPTFGTLNLDSSTGHVVGTSTVFAAANNNDRIADSATLNMRSNSVLRLTSLSGAQTTETIGTINVSGHGLIDISKQGTAPAPVAITINSLNLTGTKPTVNFTGTSLGLAGANTSRIVLADRSTSSAFLGSQFHQGNEWAKYNATAESGFAIGVTPFVAADYTVDNAETAWDSTQHNKQTAATVTLTENRSVRTLNLQPTATQTLNTAGFTLTIADGGLLTSGSTSGITGTNGAGAITSGTGDLYAHVNNTLDIKVPIVDGAAGATNFIKSGTGTVRLTHQSLGIGITPAASAPFSTQAWSSTMTGSWIINDGILTVQRGQFLNGRPIVLNGGALEINQPVSIANRDTVLANWGNNVIVNGNASLVMDDNGESNDANVGGNALVPMGSLTVNNGSTLTFGSFANTTISPATTAEDLAFKDGATFNGRATLNVGVRSGGASGALILGGAVTGDGFDMVAYGGTAQTVILGGTATDTTNNTFNTGLVLYGGTLRVNKANGSVAIPDTAANEDVVINGGTLAWGAGDHGDLSTTNNVAVTNNGLTSGIAPTSPDAIKNAGQNQIADTATVTLLSGNLGESDRINNEKWGTLIQKNGTLNVGLGKMEVNVATISGGGFGIDRGGTFKAGTLTLLPGAYSPNVTTGLPTPAGVTTLEVGAGGLSLSGQNIILGTGSSGNVAGSGAVLKLGGDVTMAGNTLIGGSYGRSGIFVQTGNSFRELGNSRVDLAGGNRTFTISEDSQFTITAPITNGGLVKAGAGGLILESYQPSNFTGAIVVNGGVLSARADGAFGTSDGGVTIGNNATVKLESGWVYGDSFTISGSGALIPGDSNVREIGALVSDTGTNRITGAVTLAGNATIASNTVTDPSAAPAAAGAAYKISNLRIESAGGVTGNGTLTLSGHGDGVIVNGVNLASGGLNKDGAGRWTISGASTYTGGTSITAGALRITNGAALGSTAAGTTVFGGSLEVAGGISVAEPLNVSGFGSSTQSGAVVNIGGVNTLSATVALGGDTTLRSDAGSLVLSNSTSISGGNSGVTLSGAGTGTVQGAIALGNSSLTKIGSGTWTLAGNNTFTGATNVNGGVLALDYSVNNGSKLHGASAVNLGGGTLSILGNATAATSQTIGSLNVNAGGGTLTVTSAGTQSASLNIGAITRAAGGTLNVVLPANGSITTSATPVNGILGAYATVGGADWATKAGSNIVALTNYSPLSAADATDSANSRITTAQTQSGSVTTNSLKIDNAAGLALGSNNLTLTSGGLTYSGSRVAGISGTGVISGASMDDELIIHTSGGILDIANPLIGLGAGSLTKAGSGTLVLRGASSFTGAININGGTLSIVGPGGTTHPTALGSATGPSGLRSINVNGGTFQVAGGDYDPGATNMQFVFGTSGGTIRSYLGAQITINDPSQFQGSGDVTFTGGGRYNMSGGTPVFPDFKGTVTVDGGILIAGNSATLGGRQEQTLTLKPGSAIINNTGFGVGLNGLPNNMVLQGGTEVYAVGGNRVYGGNIDLSGRNTVALMERDNLTQERQVYFNGRVSGTGVTLDVYGVNNGNPLYLTGGSNDLTGTINLNANAVLEARTPGSVGVNNGDVTVNLAGANSRLLLRNYQNGDYRTNVVVGDNVEINSDRLVNFAGGANQLLSINNLTVSPAANGKILTFASGNSYTTRVGGAATFNANAIVNATGNVLFENGVNFAGGANLLDKRGGGSVILRGAANNTGATIVQQGFLILQGNGALPNSSSIEVRGGELRIDNSDVINTNRLNDAGALVLGGGVVRITGAETLPTVTAAAGTTQVVYNPTSETNATALTLTGFTRQTGAVVQFQSPDVGVGTTGAATFGNTRVSSRILIPGQANTGATEVIPGLFGNNNLDFIQYDGTTMDNGAPLGVRDTRNPGNLTQTFAVPYVNDVAETGWNDNVVLRSGTAATVALTANRALDAWKAEQVITLNMGANNLRIENGGIIAAGNASTINGTTGVLTAGKSVASAGVAELFIAGNNTLNINAIIGDNTESGQAVALVKTGTGTLNLGGTTANKYTGGTYVNSGTVNTTVNNAFGAASNPIHLSGGTLQFNIPSANSSVALGGLGHNVNVNASSTIILDNGTGAGTDNDLAFGSLAINGPYTLSMRGLDSMDATFTGTHVFSGTPTLDMAQAGSGSVASTFTVSGAITGSGFFVSSSGNTNDTAGLLQIGGGTSDTVANTYNGKVTLLPGSNNEDLIVELNKAAGTTAITGDLQLDGGIIRLNADNQIGDGSNVQINRGVLNFNGKNETIASVNMTGGGLVTNATTGTPAANVIGITGDVDVTGIANFGGISTGFTVGSNSTVTIGGKLRIGTFGRVHLAEGQGGAILNINGGLEMTGALLNQSNGPGANIVRLNSDVTTFASPSVSRLGNSTDSDTFLELNGTRSFTVADGGAGLDLVVSSVITNSTSPVATGTFVKNGLGVLQIEGGGTSNSYSGATTINEGTVVLFKSAGTNALGTGAGGLTIGDGNGVAKADRLVLRNSNQIADATNVTMASSGLLDLQTFNASEQINSLSGDGSVDLGPSSVLTVSGSANAAFAGSVNGGGAVTKGGSGTWTLSGASEYVGATTINAGTLEVTGSIAGSPVAVNATATLTGSGSLANVLVANGGIVAPGSGIGTLSTGSFDLNSGATLKLELGAPSVGSYDRVNVSGGITLAGDLQGTLLNGYVPSIGPDLFFVMINDGTDAISGTFNGIPEGGTVAIGGYSFTVTYHANWTGNAATSSLTGGNDVALSVPEPGTVVTLLGGMGALLGLQRFRRRNN